MNRNQYENVYWANYNSYKDYIIYNSKEIRENHTYSEVFGPFTNIKELKKAVLLQMRKERDLIVKEILKVNTLRSENIK